MTPEEFKNKTKLTGEELNLVIKNINKNMAKYDKDFKTRMEQSDKAEKRMYGSRFNGR